MKKFVVTADFIDKNTKIQYDIGSVFEASSKERANELKSSGYLGEEVITPDDKTKNAPPAGEKGGKNQPLPEVTTDGKETPQSGEVTE
ncbi:hypothetical protein PAECIP111891_06724 [Paenibacillus allorhizoplanae]|uniref:Uncharacterized protein n=1 Tax=Paenibacillus allorhizoplanae TaxID=2905648 RepID=A0ABN8HAT4_9BACL|nr:hypothetical protein [Paenibacillus allorhizoplanae]CAH1230691.1 hypothetical protein PAECIP111891_06724 [Paenibacillus allorhizoplanae]